MSWRGAGAVSRRWTTLAVFLLAATVRLLFWQATPDDGWPHSALYKGDAIVWTEYAAALASGESFEAGLPLRPPGNAYLLHWLGVGGPRDVAGAKLVWCLLGATVAAVFYRAALAVFGSAVALVVGLWTALSTGLLMLSTSLNNETPYLLLVGVILLLTPRLARGATVGWLLTWGGLHGVACLVRVEHALFAVLALGWLALVRWREARRGDRVKRLLPLVAAVALGAGLAMTPWHLAAWKAIGDFNSLEPKLPAAVETAQRRLEAATAGLRWAPEALAERQRLPAFARRSAGGFVAATVLIRGGREIRAEDFEILEQAFGSRPRALRARPFVALYGPLNFALANRAGAPPGFDPDGLDRPPPLVGGIDRYPRALLAGLPPRQLTLSYPPHLEMVTDGYRLGWQWIVENPRGFLGLALRRLDVAWSGAALGWTGRGLPWGLEGERRAVDLTVPRGRGFAVWRALLLIVCLAGVWLGRGAGHLQPWLLFAACKLVVVVAFFGYARHGAALIPVVALLVALAAAVPARRIRSGLERERRALLVAGVIALVGLGVEAQRWMRPPNLTVDGHAIGARDPIPPGEHRDRTVRVSG